MIPDFLGALKNRGLLPAGLLTTWVRNSRAPLAGKPHVTRIGAHAIRRFLLGLGLFLRGTFGQDAVDGRFEQCFESLLGAKGFVRLEFLASRRLRQAEGGVP